LYTFSEEFINEDYEIGLIKLDGELEFESRNDLRLDKIKNE